MQAFQYELIHLRKNCLVSQRHNDELMPCYYLWPTEDVKEEINVRSIENSQPVEHQDLRVGLRSFGKQAFLKDSLQKESETLKEIFSYFALLIYLNIRQKH
jgi:hypothetical protein